MEPNCPRNEVIFENFDTVPYAYIPEILESRPGDIEVSEGRLQPIKKTKWAETLKWEPGENTFLLKRRI